jgi:hypothetical protein
MKDMASILRFMFPSANFINRDIVVQNDGGDDFIAEWNIGDPQPNETAINAQRVASVAAAAAEVASRQGRKTAVLAKLGLVAGDVQAFNELVADKNIT